jgi:hypothetical protein
MITHVPIVVSGRMMCHKDTQVGAAAITDIFQQTIWC